MGTSQSVPAAPSGDAVELPRAAEVPFALVVCGPSGVGKGTLISWLMSAHPESFGFSVSHTTRNPRPNEQDGVDYHFVNKDAMAAAIEKGLFLEHAEVHGNLYGTSVAAVQDVLGSGKCCILDIDVQGARLVRKASLQAIFVFIAPPSEDELLKRLRGRGTETEEVIAKRAANAREEMKAIEEAGLFDFLIINDSLESAQEQILRVAGLALSAQDPSTLELEDQAADGDNTATGASKAPPSADNKGKETASEPAAQPAQEVKAAAEVAEQAAKAGSLASPASLQPEGDREIKAAQVETEPSLAGKVAVVTGASTGVGREVAIELLQIGVKVVAVARRRERLEQLQADTLELGINPSDFLPIVCDVTKEAEVLALPRIIGKRWPGSGIDLLINNAAVGNPDGSLVSGSTAAWVEMISTNVLGLSMCTREAVQDMERRRVQSGHIVNIGQLADAVNTTASEAFYGATKAAVAALTSGLRDEVQAKGLPVRVSLISPSAVRSDFARTARASEKGPALLEPQDVAAAVLWCLTAPAHVDVGEVVLRPLP